MNMIKSKKAIIITGPGLILVNLFVLLFSVIKVMATFGLVSGIIFNKKIKHVGLSYYLPRVFGVAFLMILVITLIHFIMDSDGNYYLGMIFGMFIFAFLLCIFSYNNIKKEKKLTLITITILSLLFLIIAELAVYITIW